MISCLIAVQIMTLTAIEVVELPASDAVEAGRLAAVQAGRMVARQPIRRGARFGFECDNGGWVGIDLERRDVFSQPKQAADTGKTLTR